MVKKRNRQAAGKTNGDASDGFFSAATLDDEVTEDVLDGLGPAFLSDGGDSGELPSADTADRAATSEDIADSDADADADSDGDPDPHADVVDVDDLADQAETVPDEDLADTHSGADAVADDATEQPDESGRGDDEPHEDDAGVAPELGESDEAGETLAVDSAPVDELVPTFLDNDTGEFEAVESGTWPGADADVIEAAAGESGPVGDLVSQAITAQVGAGGAAGAAALSSEGELPIHLRALQVFLFVLLIGCVVLLVLDYLN